MKDIKITDGPDGLKVYEIEVSEGRWVGLRELNLVEFGALVDGHSGSDWSLVQKGIKKSLVSDRGEELKREDLVGALFAQRFRPREVMSLRLLWTRLHMVDDAVVESIRELRVG